MKANLLQSGLLGLFMLCLLPGSFAVTRYVDAASTGANNGTSWSNAYRSLADAVVAAHSNPAIDTILIAQGVYYPEQFSTGTQNRDKAFTFTRGGLTLLGGYATGGVSRNVSLYPTILSGDIGVEDVNTDNSYHVILIAGNASNPLNNPLSFDGIIIEKGNANVVSTPNVNGSPTYRNRGAAVHNSFATSVFSNCVIRNNNGIHIGGATYNTSGRLTFETTTFVDNQGEQGAAIGNHLAGHLTVNRCLFSSNVGLTNGGVIMAAGTDATALITNSVFSGNKANISGGAIANSGSYVRIVNTTISGNAATVYGGGIYNFNTGRTYISNSILYGNNLTQIANASGGGGFTSYSLIEGEISTAGGNLNGNTNNPMFINAPSHTSAPFKGGDYRLDSLSPCINKGNTDSLPSIYDKDFAGNTRVLQDTIDMGAYELVGADVCMLNISYNLTNIKCFNEATGVINVAATGGNAPYQYSINGGAYTSNNVFTGLAADTYLIAVEDASGCANEVEVTLNQPSARLSSTASFNHPTCTEGGSIEINVEGGTPPYLFSVNDSAFTDIRNYSNVPVGIYFITVKDNAECMNLLEVELKQFSTFASTVAVTQPSCGSEFGTIAVTATGGTTPYQYSINNLPFVSNPLFENLSGGTYTVITRDNAGCTKEEQVIINAFSQLNISHTKTDIACFNAATGAIEVTVAGGNAPYQYSINGGTYASNNVFTGLAADTYLIAVEDASGCANEIEVILTQPSARLSSTASFTHPTCTEGGSIEINVEGGTPPYQFSVNDSAFTDIRNYSNVPVGIYFITVKDNAECTNLLEVELKQFSTFNSSVEVTQPSCGSASGIIEVTATGGTTPYQYSINNSPFVSNPLFENLSTGTYLVIARDNAGCTKEIQVTLAPITTLRSTSNVIQPACGEGAGGSIEVSISGGAAPYTYLWSNAATTASISNLMDGTYTLITTDNEGCQLYDTFNIITFEGPLLIDLGEDRSLCSQQILTLDGDIEVEGTVYVWTSTNGFTATTAQVSVSDAGTYTVVATTPDGCTATGDITITISEGIISSDFVVASQGFMDSIITLVNISDPRPDSIDWILPPSCTIISEQFGFAEISFADSGFYQVGMRAYRGACYEDKFTQIVVVEASAYNQPDIPKYPFIKIYEAYPNPSNGSFSVKIELQKDADISLKLINVTTGKIADVRNESISKEALIPYNVTLEQGTYILLLETPFGFRGIKIQIL